MSFKATILDKLISWGLESKVSPLGWINGYKRHIGLALSLLGTFLTGISATVVAVQVALVQAGICPGWEYCGYLDQTVAIIGVVTGLLTKLLGLLTKLVGDWHAAIKDSRVE